MLQAKTTSSETSQLMVGYRASNTSTFQPLPGSVANACNQLDTRIALNNLNRLDGDYVILVRDSATRDSAIRDTATFGITTFEGGMNGTSGINVTTGGSPILSVSTGAASSLSLYRVMGSFHLSMVLMLGGMYMVLELV